MLHHISEVSYLSDLRTQASTPLFSEIGGWSKMLIAYKPQIQLSNVE
jgi:hypothetical protein